LVEFEGNNSTHKDTIADSICVDGNKTVTELDVQRNLARKQFFSSETTTYGSNSCKMGYVWRALDAYDYVCVSPSRRDAAQSEVNKQEERLSSTGGECQDPWLNRNAFSGDEVCVSPAEKFRILRENLQSPHILMLYSFFNGIDTVT